MFFDSTVYLVFLVLVTVLYWRLRFRAQNCFLLLASYFFYGWWDWRFLLLMGTSTVVDFFVARGLDAFSQLRQRRALLILSLAVNFSFLGFFKYCNFFVDSFAQLAALLGLKGIPASLWQIVLPPAISFYTFQEVAYIVDVYHRKIKSADSLLDYALFVSLFPHLIAGPIQRPSHLLPQVQQPRVWDPARAFDGMILILEGLFRKVVIADNCALIANAAFSGNFGGPSLVTVVLGTVAFAWQIYGDFSGYSSIARGSAQLLGFHFMVNFRQPYLAQSLQDFWRRWHMSLSSWLRDYLYIPLGGNRRGRARTYRNLMLTMLLGGLWHGANWTFVAWGLYHGTLLCLFRAAGLSDASPAGSLAARLAWLGRVVLMFHLTCLGWLLFRADNFHTVIQMGHLMLTDLRWTPFATASLATIAFYCGVILLLEWLLDGEFRMDGLLTKA